MNAPAGQPRLTLAAVSGLIRARFLVMAPIYAALGWTSAHLAGASTEPVTLVLVFVGAISAHIAVNALNEHDDFQSGLDLQTQRTGFSGGSGTLPENPGLVDWAWRIGIGALALTIAVGLILLALTPQAWKELVLLGAIGVATIYTYTPWINKQPWLCLVAPGLGFGLLMVLGTHLVLRGQLDGLAWAMALVPFALANNLLLLNQLPDMSADRNAGRRTLPVVYGRPVALLVYTLFGLFTYAWIITGSLLDLWPAGGLAALLTLPLLGLVVWGVARDGGNLERYLGLNVVLTLVTPLLFMLGVLVQAAPGA